MDIIAFIFSSIYLFNSSGQEIDSERHDKASLTTGERVLKRERARGREEEVEVAVEPLEEEGRLQAS